MYTRRLARASRNSPMARRSPTAHTRCWSPPTVASAVGLVPSMWRAIAPSRQIRGGRGVGISVGLGKLDPDEVVRVLGVKAVALFRADDIVRRAQELAERLGLIAIAQRLEWSDVGHSPILTHASDDN